MSEPGPAALIMARAPRRGQVRTALEPVLGVDGCVALQAELIARAGRWARQAVGEQVFVAHEPPDGARELRVLLGAERWYFPQNGEGVAARLADASSRVFARNPGPLLIVWPELPRLHQQHAEAALSDLEDGCDVVLGPTIDGGFYLIAIRRPLPALFALPEPTWRSPDVMSISIAAAREAGLEVGILRAERGLHHPADVRAALADPLMPAAIVKVLDRANGDRSRRPDG